MTSMKRYLTEMKPKEVEEAFKKTDIAVIPAGAIHAHGAAVPLGFDVIVAEKLADRIAEETDAVVLPVIPLGYAKYHGDFSGTISVTRSSYFNMLLETCEWLHKWGARKIVYIPCHLGDEPQIQEVAYECRYRWNMLSVSLEWWTIAKDLMPEIRKYYPPGVTGWGEGLTEDMSVMLYLRPDLVDVSKETFKEQKQLLGDNFEALGLWDVKFKQSMVRFYLRNKDLSDTSGFGPHMNEINYLAEANAKLGERIFATVVDYMVDFIREFRKANIPPI